LVNFSAFLASSCILSPPFSVNISQQRKTMHLEKGIS
jgi:hypothetical protein